jgi:spore maturation protein CgeB
MAGNRILYVGDLCPGSTAEMRMRALGTLGFSVTGVNNTSGPISACRNPIQYLAIKMRRPMDAAGVNARIAEDGPGADIVWIDKGVTIRPETLASLRARAPSVSIIGYSPDDMINRNMSSHFFRRTLPFYDVFFTTKTYNVAELRDLGCRRVIFVPNAYDPATHRPLDGAGNASRVDVGFIGTYEPDRASLLTRLAGAGIQVVIRGNLWEPMKRQRVPGITFLPAVIEDDYAAAISATRINLAFLRKSNRDLQTTRSVEIPACGGFMLAERTAEHAELFAEGVEAAYFEGPEELIAKTNYYLAHEDERAQIACAARGRCLRDDYSYAGRLRAAIETAGFAIPRAATPE